MTLASSRRRAPVYIAVTQVAATHLTYGYWRGADGAANLRYNRIGPWVDLVRKLEAGGLDAIFFVDLLGMYDTYEGSWRPAARYGVQVPCGDPAMLVSALAAATEHLGIAITGSVMQDHPFAFARKMSTLDHFTEGRLAWNIVSSYLDNASRNFGLAGLLSHEDRYAWADEYVDVAYKLWEGSWEDDAVVLDPQTATYTDPDKIHQIDHTSGRYTVSGPHLCEPSPQRTPVLFQAGSSDIGRAFGAGNGEVIFLTGLTPQGAGAEIADLRARAAAVGRAPGDVLGVCPLAFVLGSTEQEAQQRLREFQNDVPLDAMKVFWSGLFGVDLVSIDIDMPLKEVRKVDGVQGTFRAVLESAPDDSMTVADLMRQPSSLQRACTPEQVADLAEVYLAAGVDGFNLVPVSDLGNWFGEFVEHVVPVLRSRGLMQDRYAQGTLREKLFPGGGPYLPATHPARGYRTWADRTG
jgi:long-chain alkane monooxygenase